MKPILNTLPVRAKALIIQKINNKKSNKMKLNIAVLAGDGIGPEIMKQGVAVMQADRKSVV